MDKRVTGSRRESSWLAVFLAFVVAALILVVVWFGVRISNQADDIQTSRRIVTSTFCGALNDGNKAIQGLVLAGSRDTKSPGVLVRLVDEDGNKEVRRLFVERDKRTADQAKANAAKIALINCRELQRRVDAASK